MRSKGAIGVVMVALVLLIVSNACKKDSDTPVGPGGSYVAPATNTPTRKPGTGDVIGRVFPVSASGSVVGKQGAQVVAQDVLAASSEYYRLHNLEPGTVFVEVDAVHHGDASVSCQVVTGEVSMALDLLLDTPTFTPTITCTPNLNYAWVADTGNNRLVRINGEGDTFNAYIDTYDGNTFTTVTGLSVDNTNGAVWVAVQGRDEVAKLSTASPFATIGISTGQAAVEAVCAYEAGNQAWACSIGALDEVFLLTSAGTGRTMTMAVTTFSDPRGVAVDSNGDCWVADTDGLRVLKVKSDDTILASYITGVPASVSIKPSDVAVDLSDNSCWIASKESVASIVKLTSLGAELYVVKSPGLDVTKVFNVDVDQNDGSCWATGLSSIGGAVWKISSGGVVLGTYDVAEGLINPIDVAVDQSDGSVWVTDLGSIVGTPDADDKVVKLTSGGVVVNSVGGGSLKEPTSVDVQLAP